MTITATRTFDCPWCGAITPVPADHLGEHFPCPECKKATKLTTSNTSEGPATAAPPGAPHLSGDRTFDCPWCGAISHVPASHLGDRFHCPECAKETKLTSTNTRVGLITAPPPDAPHVEPSKGGRGVLVLIAVVVAGAAGWLLFSGGPDQPAATGDGAVALTPATQPPPATVPPAPGELASMDGAAGAGEPAAAPKDAPATPAPEPSADLLRAQGELAAAFQSFSAAAAAHDKASAAMDAWKKEHAGALEAAAAAAALDDVRAEFARLASDRSTLPDPSHPTPEQARAVRAAHVAVLGASPARAAVAERVHAWLRDDLQGREAASAPDWKALDWRGSGVTRALAALSAAASATAASLPAELASAEAEARKARDAANQRIASAEARVKELSAPR